MTTRPIQDLQQNEYDANGVPLHAPGASAAVAAQSDSVDLPNPSRGVYVGGQGDLKVDMVGGQTVTFLALAAGLVHPLRVRRIYATGTSATGIVVVY